MTDYAAAIRRATLKAARIHRDLGLREGAVREGRIDIFDVIARLNVPLIFRPLDKLLGAYLCHPTPGVLVTTKRPLSVQRFTAAHELGHHQLGHKPSLDDETILRRAPFFARRGDKLQEVEADAFAAAFLLPRWLIAWHCERQGWNDAAFRQPEIVYQLSIRVGTSYTATCWTLHRYRIIDRRTANQLAGIEPKAIKRHLLGNIRPPNFYGDVWLLTDRDAGTSIEGGPSDLFIMRLTEHAGAGYLWHLDTIDGDTFAVVGDARESNDATEVIGSPVMRRITTQSRRRNSGELRLAETRPWQNGDQLHTFALRYDLMGAEQEGWSRAERRYRLEAA